jgi:hypothetical protein
VRIYDNSHEADPVTGSAPRPLLVLHAADGVIRETCAVTAVPQWAKPVFIAVLRQYST